MMTTQTRERLWAAERERDEMRRAAASEKERARAMRGMADKERAIAERPKREGSEGPSKPEAELRVLRFKYNAMKARSQSPSTSTDKVMEKSCTTDLLFLMDTTGSMGSYVDAARDQVKNIADDIRGPSSTMPTCASPLWATKTTATRPTSPKGQELARKCPDRRASSYFLSHTASLGMRMAKGATATASASAAPTLKKPLTGGVSIFGGRR